MIQVVNLKSKLEKFSEHWAPKIVSTYNGNDLMVAKLQGEFIWHAHPDTDDFFLVLKGNLIIELRDRDLNLGPGDLCVIPKGVEHRPKATEEVHLLLIESTGAPNTGDVKTAVWKETL